MQVLWTILRRVATIFLIVILGCWGIVSCRNGSQTLQACADDQRISSGGSRLGLFRHGQDVFDLSSIDLTSKNTNGLYAYVRTTASQNDDDATYRRIFIPFDNMMRSSDLRRGDTFFIRPTDHQLILAVTPESAYYSQAQSNLGPAVTLLSSYVAQIKDKISAANGQSFLGIILCFAAFWMMIVLVYTAERRTPTGQVDLSGGECC